MVHKLMAVEKDPNTKRNDILLNVIKMLSARKLIDKNNIEKIFSPMKDVLVDDLTYKIKTDNNEIYVVKIINQNLNTVSKSSTIMDFMVANKDVNKIVIATEIAKKAYKQIIDFPNSEPFWDYEFLINLIDHKYQPKIEVLTDSQANEVLDKYIAKKRDMPRMESTDPIARYYKLKAGDMIRVVRPSISAGRSIIYRIIVSSPVSKLYE